MNKYIKENIILLISILVLLQPLIDVVIGFCSLNGTLSLIASLIRVIILGFLIYYLIFINNSKSKRIIVLILGTISVYLLFYFMHMNYNFLELKTALKIFYFPILFSILFCVKEEEGKFIEEKYLLMSLFIYSFVIVFGFITNTAFQSYQVAKEGLSGYFNAANEISGIIAILLPFVFDYVLKKINYKKTLYFAFIILSIFILGTKTPIISLLICSIYYIIKGMNKNNYIKTLTASAIVIIILLVVIPITPIYKNTMIHASFLKLHSVKQLITDPCLIDHFVFGSRLQFLKNNTEVYLDSGLGSKFLGIGYTKNTKMAEMDFNDIFYRQGLIGFLLYFTLIFYIIFLNNGRVNNKHILPVVLIILTAGIVGHVITAPAVGTFVAYIMCLFKKERKV